MGRAAAEGRIMIRCVCGRCRRPVFWILQHRSWAPDFSTWFLCDDEDGEVLHDVEHCEP